MAKATCSQRPMLPLNNELEHIKIILHPAFFKGRYFMAVCMAAMLKGHNHILFT